MPHQRVQDHFRRLHNTIKRVGQLRQPNAPISVSHKPIVLTCIGGMSGNDVGFAGLGAMGLQMAARLQQHLKEQGQHRKLIVWNRTLSKADPLTQEGAQTVQHAADLGKHCSIIFTMLGDDRAVRSVVRDILGAGLAKGTVIVECSTIHPSLTEELDSRANELGCHLLACPVFGRPDAVKAGNALFVCAGDPSAKQKVEPLLRAMGSSILDCGPTAKAGSIMKLVGNFTFMSYVETVSEALALADAGGLPRASVTAFLDRIFPGFVTKDYTETLAQDRFEPTPEKPGFKLEGGMKDAKHMRQLATDLNVPLPLCDLFLGHMQSVRNNGGGDLDWASLALAVRKNAGVPVKPDVFARKQ